MPVQVFAIAEIQKKIEFHPVSANFHEFQKNRPPSTCRILHVTLNSAALFNYQFEQTMRIPELNKCVHT